VQLPESKDEEIASTITHGAGVIVTLIAIPSLLIHASYYCSPTMIGALCVFGIGMLSVYLSSTLYHWVTPIILKKRLRVWDHASIFLLIAGTYTPVIVKFLPKTSAIIFLSIMWSIVVAGIFMKIFFWKKLKIVSLALYLLLGWMAVFVLKPIITNMPGEIFWWILAGGLAYTLGVPFFAWKKVKYNHAIWHCFVLAGTACHFIAIYKSLPVIVKM